MEILGALRTAWQIFGGASVEEPWVRDESAFEAHFECSYAEFEERLTRLDHAHSALYEKTLEVNPEAAICWVFFITSG